MPLDLPILLGTARRGNETRHVAEFLREQLAARDGVVTELYAAGELPFGDLEAGLWSMDEVPPEMATFRDAMDRADGFLLCFPEYNHGYPGALKNLLDHLGDPWNHKPFALVSTGGLSGGVRALEQLRVVVGGCGGIPIPRSISVPRVGDEFDAEGPVDREAWERRADGLIDELLWYARALARARAAGPPA